MKKLLLPRSSINRRIFRIQDDLMNESNNFIIHEPEIYIDKSSRLISKDNRSFTGPYIVKLIKDIYSK